MATAVATGEREQTLAADDRVVDGGGDGGSSWWSRSPVSLA